MRSLAAILVLSCLAFARIQFKEATIELGLADVDAGGVQWVELDGDGRIDLVASGGTPAARRVFLNRVDASVEPGFRFVERAEHGLPVEGSVSFADFDGDGKVDALWAPYWETSMPDFKPPEGLPDGPALYPGNGDGTFGEPRRIACVKPKTHHVIAIGDVDRDGRLDFWLGASYLQAPWLVEDSTGEGFPSDLALQVSPGEFVREPLPEDAGDFAKDPDSCGIPTYGGLITPLDGTGLPYIVQLGYGRRVNRVWRQETDAQGGRTWSNAAPAIGLDGDTNRDPTHPDWIRRYAKKTGNFGWVLEESPPWLVHGNTFDGVATDLDNDGDLDLFLAQIRHGWAGPSSDPTAVWMNRQKESGALRFDMIDPEGTLARRPPDDDEVSWNEGDLICEAADFDHDGLVDLLLASGDYPDPQRLRVFRQKPGGRFVDVTNWSGLLFHDGCQQLSLADIDADGDLDVVAGQAFVRYSEAQKDGRPGPRIAVFLNQATVPPGVDPLFLHGKSIVLHLRGDPGRGVNPHGIGALVRLTTKVDDAQVTQTRVLAGPGGRGGKQGEFCAHFGLGAATRAEKIEILVPCTPPRTITLRDVEPGIHEVPLVERE